MKTSLTKTDVGLGNVTNDAQVKRSEMGKANGVATLGADSKLTAAQLPALKTINSQSIVGSGNITIDLSLFTVVESLPTARRMSMCLGRTATRPTVPPPRAPTV